MDPRREQLFDSLGFELKIRISDILPNKEITYVDQIFGHNFSELVKVDIGQVIHDTLRARKNIEWSSGLVDHYFHEFLHDFLVPVTCFQELKTLVQKVSDQGVELVQPNLTRY
jgi:hypothetical protein